MPTIVRVLWGEEVGTIGRWAKVWTNDVVPRLKIDWTCPQSVYVYGKRNAELLADKTNCDVVLVNDNPFPDGMVDQVKHGQIRRPWHYKWQLLRQAIVDHGEVIYCDWDVTCLVGDIGLAFGLLESRDTHLSAYMYKRVRHPFREGYKAQRFACVGNWLHFRGTEFIDRMLSRMGSPGLPWSWHDEFTMGYMIDEDHGSWPGEEVWLNQYESPIMCQRNRRSPWTLVSDDGNVVRRKTPVPFEWHRLFCQYSRR